jgi:AAA family ATP:ADP antiporter
MFERMGWKGVAGATPLLLLWGGMFFFTACMVYQISFAGEWEDTCQHELA